MSLSSKPNNVVIRSCGDSAFLIELGTLDRVLAMHAQLTANPLPGVVDVLAAATTVMVQAVSPSAAKTLAAQVHTFSLDVQVDRDDTLIEINVLYDGEDLAEVASLTNLSIDGVIEAHTSQLWTAAFGGFAPGFAYCIGENHTLDVPRRSSPRTMVTSGSVGLAGYFSGVYPRNSPGGWQLLGRTDSILWDTERVQPALIAPGNRVRYVPVREFIAVVPSKKPEAQPVSNGLRIISPGLQSIITDLGRPGYADLGVAESGAMDQRAATSANALVGNPPGLAVIETTYAGLSVQALGNQIIAVTGVDASLTITPADSNTSDADSTSPQLANLPAQPTTGQQFTLLDGEILTLGTPTTGLRAYVAVRGGIAAPLVLGSASTNLLSGEGPAPLAAGELLPVAESTCSTTAVHQENRTAEISQLATDPKVIHITLGPRDDWFDETQIASLLTQQWVISNHSNRIGFRLEGTPLVRANKGELLSEGVVAGALQVPPAGLPVILMRDHPVTGGYPVIGVVNSADLDDLAQLPPGSRIKFVSAVSPQGREPSE